LSVLRPGLFHSPLLSCSFALFPSREAFTEPVEAVQGWGLARSASNFFGRSRPEAPP
jgi:hypothetical protein